MQSKTKIPAFVSVITFLLGCYDLLRGFMHTFELKYSALNIAVLDLSTPQASDLLELLGAFGISNYITGVMLILISLRDRTLALIMLAVIPLAYLIGILNINSDKADYIKSKAAWGGMEPMLIYLCICTISFFIGLIVTIYRNK